MDNYRPHRPTFVSTLVVVALLFVVYHLTFGRRKRG